jgi:hypothetical protein
MGLFDDYNFDPQQFEGGGLLGRLLSLQQQQGQYQQSQGFDASGGQPVAAASPSQFPSAASSTPHPSIPQASGPTAFVPIGNYLMPQFGGAGTSQPDQPTPDLGDRLSAGFQSWAHTPLGNPFAGIANGIAGFSSGQTVSQPSPQNSLPRNDTPQQRSVSDEVPPSLPAPAWNNQRTLVGRVLPRPNGANFVRGFRYGG